MNGWFGIFIVLCAAPQSYAQTQHHLVRRISVFPVKADPSLAKAAEDAWWSVREVLTENKRFLVASKNFLAQKDVFQPRAELQPADAITLGSLLDANALVTLYLENRRLNMVVYDVDYGRVLWRYDLSMNPSIPIDEQLANTAKKLTNDFIASIPYQGFLVIDPLKNSPTYIEKKQTFMKVQIGLNSQIAIGDDVQVINVNAINFQPVFLDGGRVEVYAEGKVVALDRETATVEVNRISKEKLKELALVRFPKELDRLQAQFRSQDKSKVNLPVAVSDMKAAQEEVREYKPLIAAIAFIANVAAFILLGL